jgi:hypothetical protein
MSRTRLILPALLATAGLALPASALANFETKPTGLVCMTYNAQKGTGVARLGAYNSDIAIQSIPAGDLNYFDPNPANRSQPAQFAPGNSSFDQAFTAGDGTATWYINGVPAAVDHATAGLPFDRPCPDRGPSITAVTPVAAAPGAAAQRLTVFGQGLKGGSVSVSGSGVSLADPGATTEQRIDATMTVASDATPGARDVLVTSPSGEQVGCRGCLVLDPNARGVTGPAGPKGDTGPAGPAGPAGKDAVGAVSRVTGTPVAFDRDGTITAVANCPAGTKVISGGYELTGTVLPSLTSVFANRATSATQWGVTVRLDGIRAGRRLTASATCLG